MLINKTHQRKSIQTADQIKKQPLYNKLYQTYSKIRNTQLLVGKSSEHSIMRDIVTSPYRRIKKVQKLIFEQKKEEEDRDQFENAFANFSLKPNIKIKNGKCNFQRRSIEFSNSEGKKKQEQKLNSFSLTIQCKKNSQEPQIKDSQKSHTKKVYQQIIRNREKLQRRNHHNSNEVSLLEMLNRISATPIQRYKSKVFNSARRVMPLRLEE